MIWKFRKGPIPEEPSYRGANGMSVHAFVEYEDVEEKRFLL
jgi:hypothetical protein